MNTSNCWFGESVYVVKINGSFTLLLSGCLLSALNVTRRLSYPGQIPPMNKHNGCHLPKPSVSFALEAVRSFEIWIKASSEIYGSLDKAVR